MRTLTLTLLAGVLCLTSSAVAAVVINTAIPVSGAVFNPCNGETVTFNGVDHFTASIVFDGAGGFHADQHDNVHVTATGSLGNSYEGNQEDTFIFNGRLGFEN